MSNKNLLTVWAVRVVVAGILTMAAQVTSAQTQETARPIWMATSAEQASLAGAGHGRLTVADGELAYDSNAVSWRIALSEIKRISASKIVSNALEVEGYSGQRYFVGILNGQLTMVSPGKAVQTIQRAVRSAPAPQPARAAATAAGGGGGTQ